MLPALALSYRQPISGDTFAEFQQLVAADGLVVEVEEREDDGPYAGIEWVIPTVVILFIGKAYFDGFLKEMGKDHYSLLKAGLKSLYAKLLGPNAPEVSILSTKGKSSPEQPYSLVYSLLAEAEGTLRFKLLLQRSASQEEYEATISAFLSFLEAYHSGALDPEVIDELENTRVIGRTLLLAFSPVRNRVVPIDPLAGKKGDGA